MQKSTRSNLLAMATLALAGAGFGVTARVVDRDSLPAYGSGGTRTTNKYARSERGPRRSRNPGWTQAHVQRMARKRRNQQRNKRAHRG